MDDLVNKLLGYAVAEDEGTDRRISTGKELQRKSLEEEDRMKEEYRKIIEENGGGFYDSSNVQKAKARVQILESKKDELVEKLRHSCKVSNEEMKQLDEKELDLVLNKDSMFQEELNRRIKDYKDQLKGEIRIVIEDNKNKIEALEKKLKEKKEVIEIDTDDEVQIIEPPSRSRSHKAPIQPVAPRNKWVTKEELQKLKDHVHLLEDKVFRMERRKGDKEKEYERLKRELKKLSKS